MNCAKTYIQNKISVSSDGCWNWTGCLNPYGVISNSWTKTYKTTLVHRMSYMAFKGHIPKGQQVCHSCDNPACCNPDHLWLGTIGDNMRDRTAKGRTAKGSKNAASKLTEAQIVEIKAKLGKVTGRELAKQYKVTETLISYIKQGKIWTHVRD